MAEQHDRIIQISKSNPRFVTNGVEIYARFPVQDPDCNIFNLIRDAPGVGGTSSPERYHLQAWSSRLFDFKKVFEGVADILREHGFTVSINLDQEG